MNEAKSIFFMIYHNLTIMFFMELEYCSDENIFNFNFQIFMKLED